jgi:hypothetical protein
MDVSPLPPYRGLDDGPPEPEREPFARGSLGGALLLVAVSVLVLAAGSLAAFRLVAMLTAAPAG